MAPLAYSHGCEGRCLLSRWRPSFDERRAAFAAEPFPRLDGSAALGARRDERRPASCTEFASFAIVAATFRTAHIAPLRLRWLSSVRVVLSFSSFRSLPCRS